MERRYTPIVQITLVLILAGMMIIVSGCIIVTHSSDTIAAGESFKANITMTLNLTGTYPIYLGINLPSDEWTVEGSPILTKGLDR